MRRNRSFGRQKDRVLRRFLITSAAVLAVAWIVAPTAFADSSTSPEAEATAPADNTTIESTSTSGKPSSDVTTVTSTETVPASETTSPAESSDPATDESTTEPVPVTEQPPADDPVPPPVTVTPPADESTPPVEQQPPVEVPPPPVTPPTDVVPEQPPVPDVGPDQPTPAPETKVGQVHVPAPTLVAPPADVTAAPDSKSQRVLDKLVPQGENRPGHATHHSAVPQLPTNIFTRELPRPERSPTSSGSSGASGGSFSPDNAGARFALLGLLLSLMGASYLVLFAAREPKALCLLLRLERPG